MLLHEQIVQSLASLKGLASAVPKTGGWSVDGGPAVEIDFTAVDTLGCAFRELRVSADELKNAEAGALRAWAETLCRRVTYLLEHIGPLEVDSQAQTVLVRSTPPAKAPEGTTFYELLLKAPGTLCLRRYNRAGQSERQPIDIQVTCEVLLKLVRDIVQAIPAATAD